MEIQITDAATSSELTLAEPHFDDEATLLSARRVVPLDEVSPYGSQATSRFAHGWMFAATVVGALLLGVVASVAYYSYLNREPAQLFVDTETIVGGVDGVSTEPPQASANLSQVNNILPPDSNPALTGQEAPASPSPSIASNEAKRPVARRVDVLTSASTPDEMQA